LSRGYARRHGSANVSDGAVVRHCRGPAGDGLCECARRLFISYVFKKAKPQMKTTDTLEAGVMVVVMKAEQSPFELCGGLVPTTSVMSPSISYTVSMSCETTESTLLTSVAVVSITTSGRTYK